MIQFREVKDTDCKQLEVFLSKHHLRINDFFSYLHHSMLLEIDEVVLGFAAFRMLDDHSTELISLIVDQDHRSLGYGDGLLKAMLNMADLRGIKFVYTTCHEHSFLEHLGFKPANDVSLPEYTLKVILPDYFSTVCKSKKR